MLKNELINYLETNYNFNYGNQSKNKLEDILEDYIAIECNYNEDMVVDMMSYILQGNDIINYNN